MVLGIQVGLFGDRDDLAMVASNGITFPNVRDSGSVAAAFGLLGVPEAYFLDTDTRVRAVDRGAEVGVDERRGLVLWSAIPTDILERHISDIGDMARPQAEPATTAAGAQPGVR